MGKENKPASAEVNSADAIATEAVQTSTTEANASEVNENESDQENATETTATDPDAVPVFKAEDGTELEFAVKHFIFERKRYTIQEAVASAPEVLETLYKGKSSIFKYK